MFCMLVLNDVYIILNPLTADLVFPRLLAHSPVNYVVFVRVEMPCNPNTLSYVLYVRAAILLK